MGSSLAGETAAINNRIIIKSRAKGARDRSCSAKERYSRRTGTNRAMHRGRGTMRCELGERKRERIRREERKGKRERESRACPMILSAPASKPFGKSRTNPVNRGTNDSTSHRRHPIGSESNTTRESPCSPRPLRRL